MNSASASSRLRSFPRAAALSRFAPMANFSIPNSTPVTGRTSTRLCARSKKRPDRHCQRPPARKLHYSCTFRRVKGAWWSSRSSKPLSVPHTRGRGRFDSYPLRQVSVVILSGAKRSRRTPWPYRKLIHRASSTSLGMTNNAKGGDSKCHVS